MSFFMKWIKDLKNINDDNYFYILFINFKIIYFYKILIYYKKNNF